MINIKPKMSKKCPEGLIFICRLYPELCEKTFTLLLRYTIAIHLMSIRDLRPYFPVNFNGVRMSVVDTI